MKPVADVLSKSFDKIVVDMNVMADELKHTMFKKKSLVN